MNYDKYQHRAKRRNVGMDGPKQLPSQTFGNRLHYAKHDIEDTGTLDD